MRKIIDKIYNLYTSNVFPFILLAIGLIPIHFALTLGIGDDPTYINVISNPNLLQYFIDRYNQWSSRLLIEFVMILIVNYQKVWIVCDIAIMVLAAITISKLFVNTSIRKTNWIITFMMFIYPFMHMNSAGWMATTLSYSWVLAFGLFSMIPIKKMLFGERIKWYEYIFYIPAMIYATNHEQMCLILLAVYLVFTVYLFIEKKACKFLAFPIAICLSNLAFILTCPGNNARNVSEIARWFPQFGNLGFFRKIEMGFSSTMFEFIMKPNMVFSVFCGLLFLAMFLKHQKFSYRTVAAIPLISCGIFGILGSTIGRISPGVLQVINSMTETGTGLNLSSIKSWVPDSILGIVCLSILASIYLIFENKRDSLLMIFIILLGFGSRFILGFSPTIWASSKRTYIFMYFAFIICSVILYNSILKTKNKRYIDLCFLGIGTIACLSFIKTIMEV